MREHHERVHRALRVLDELERTGAVFADRVVQS
jgi:hypothetical protein